MSCVETAISNHFEVFFWYVADKPFDEVHGRYSFYHIFFVFMPVVMKGNEFTIVFINSGSGNNRTSEITTDIFDYIFRITFVRFCIDIETTLMIGIALCFYLFKRRP
mgnify:CR=1 FL=1